MSSKRSVAEILASLEGREVFHGEREVFHAGQEVHHRDQRAVHAAELEKVRQRLAAFREAAASAVEIVDQPMVDQPQEETRAPVTTAVSPEVMSKLSGRLIPSRIVRAVIASLPADEPFGPTLVASETNRRHAATLRRPLDTRTISDILRRMRAEGLLHLVQGGKAFHEALYAKGPRKRA
jgi:hypothetical protein